MRTLRSLIVTLSLAAIAACQDGSGPASPVTLRPEASLHPVRWGNRIAPVLRAVLPADSSINAVSTGPSILAGPAPSSPSVTFWAYTNKASSGEIDYLAADGTWQPYVRVEIPAGALAARPDGTPFNSIDSIQVTISVDSTQVLAHLEPTGLQFDLLTPTTLTIWYGGANLDFNGDGVIDGLDAAIEQTLGVWMQESPLDPWSLLSSVHDLVTHSFVVQLPHFSGYAVSW